MAVESSPWRAGAHCEIVTIWLLSTGNRGVLEQCAAWSCCVAAARADGRMHVCFFPLSSVFVLLAEGVCISWCPHAPVGVSSCVGVTPETNCICCQCRPWSFACSLVCSIGSPDVDTAAWQLTVWRFGELWNCDGDMLRNRYPRGNVVFVSHKSLQVLAGGLHIIACLLQEGDGFHAASCCRATLEDVYKHRMWR